MIKISACTDGKLKRYVASIKTNLTFREIDIQRFKFQVSPEKIYWSKTRDGGLTPKA